MRSLEQVSYGDVGVVSLRLQRECAQARTADTNTTTYVDAALGTVHVHEAGRDALDFCAKATQAEMDSVDRVVSQFLIRNQPLNPNVDLHEPFPFAPV